MHLTIFLLSNYRAHLFRSETIVASYFHFFCCLQKLFNAIFNTSFWMLFLQPRTVLWVFWKLLKESKRYHSFVYKAHYGYPKDVLKVPNAILWIPESILILSYKCHKKSEKHSTIVQKTPKTVLWFPKNIPILSFICLINLKGILWL